MNIHFSRYLLITFTIFCCPVRAMKNNAEEAGLWFIVNHDKDERVLYEVKGIISNCATSNKRANAEYARKMVLAIKNCPQIVLDSLDGKKIGTDGSVMHENLSPKKFWLNATPIEKTVLDMQPWYNRYGGTIAIGFFGLLTFNAYQKFSGKS